MKNRKKQLIATLEYISYILAYDCTSEVKLTKIKRSISTNHKKIYDRSCQGVNHE